MSGQRFELLKKPIYLLNYNLNFHTISVISTMPKKNKETVVRVYVYSRLRTAVLVWGFPPSFSSTIQRI